MTKIKRKIYVVGPAGDYDNWTQSQRVDRMEDADLVMFTGGSDVAPGLYGKKPHPQTSYDWRRDAEEVEEFKKALALGKTMIGICRGSQFLCVMAGGTLVQHQRHPGVHKIRCIRQGNKMDGLNTVDEITVTSTHHQRQNPCHKQDPDKHLAYEVIGWCENLSPYSEGQNKDETFPGESEIEIAYYPDIKALAIQSHPEYVYPPTEDWHKTYIAYCRKLLNNIMARNAKE